MIISILIFMTLSGALGGYFFKKASSFDLKVDLVSFSKFFITGGLFYFAGAVLNIVILKHLPYTIVFPLTSITYVWTMIISFFLLKEKITFKKMIGVSLIILGSIWLVM